MRTKSTTASVAVIAIAALAGVFAGCAATPPKPSKLVLNIAANASVNPDSSGRGSPIVVRVYQLKDEAAFSGAEFFALYDQEQGTLGPALISRQEFELAPGEQRTVDFALAADARFIGVIGAFRDIRNAQWRTLIPAPKSGLKNVVKKERLNIAIERLKLTLAAST
jgi:type VI secretion system protein VasD